MELQIKLGPRLEKLTLDARSIDALRVAIRMAFELGEDSEVSLQGLELWSSVRHSMTVAHRSSPPCDS